MRTRTLKRYCSSQDLTGQVRNPTPKQIATTGLSQIMV